MENLCRYIYAWMYMTVFTALNGTATLIVPTFVNCGDQAVLTCISFGCDLGYIFTKNSSLMYTNSGPMSGIDQGRYMATVTSNSQVQLTIINIQLPDADVYGCGCGFEKISSQTLQYQCKASTATVSVTPSKTLYITVDRLYPMPSGIVTSLTSPMTQLSGAHTCGPNPTFASHYNCTWMSTESLPDGNYEYTTTVTQGTVVSSVTGSFRLVTPASPSISNLVNINNSQVLRGVQDTALTIQCVSSGGIPAPTLAWYRGSTKASLLAQSNASDSVQQSDGTFMVTLTHSFTPSRKDDTNTVLCQVFYPGATAGTSPDPNPASAILYIDTSAVILSMSNIRAIEGQPNFALTCSASSRPPATFTWYKGTTVLASGTGSLTDNSYSYVISRVDRTHDGIYRCQARNNVGSPDSKIVLLRIKYPPTVTVSTTSFPPYTVTCTAEGYPDSYTYHDWVQIWPGYGPVATIPFNGTTLTLIDVTYEGSGAYVCSASNGVAVYGTDTTFMNGTGTLFAKAIPVLIDPTASDNKKPVAGEQGKNVSTDIVYWSNVDGSVIRCYKHVRGARLSSSSCSVVETEITVTLPVHNHRVSATGKRATVTIPIERKEDLGDYDFVVTNKQAGEAVLKVLISVPDSPTTPTLIRVDNLLNGPIVLLVAPGFHGGYGQTLVAQISTNHMTWDNVTSRNVGQDEETTILAIENMQTSTLYYVRVFAYNNIGRSRNFSATLTFTINKESDDQQCPRPVVYIAISATIAACLTLILTVLIIICVCKCCPACSERLIQRLCQCVSRNKRKFSDKPAPHQVGNRPTQGTTLSVVETKYDNTDIHENETTPSYESLQETEQHSFYMELQ